MTAIALTPLLMFQYPSVNIGRAKTARLVPISLPIPHIQVTAAQPTPARGLAIRNTI